MGRFHVMLQLLPLTRGHCVESCRFVLAPLASPSGKIIDPEPVSTWSYVLDNAHTLSTKCLARKLGGGVIFIAGLLACPHQLRWTG